MLRTLATKLATRGLGRLLPIAKVLAIVQLALLARRHVGLLTGDEQRRALTLVRRGTALAPAERDELRTLAAKLEPRAFAGSILDDLSPIPLPRRLTKPSRR